MRLTLAALALLAAVGSDTSLAATSIAPPPPHHPELASCAIAALITAIDRKDRDILSTGLKIYSDRLGEVTPDELDRFFAEFAARDVRENDDPLRLQNWGVLQVAGTHPLYVFTVRRGTLDGGHWSAWLIQFASDQIGSLRRADELWPFADGTHFHTIDDCPGAEANG